MSTTIPWYGPKPYAAQGAPDRYSGAPKDSELPKTIALPARDRSDRRVLVAYSAELLRPHRCQLVHDPLPHLQGKGQDTSMKPGWYETHNVPPVQLRYDQIVDGQIGRLELDDDRGPLAAIDCRHAGPATEWTSLCVELLSDAINVPPAA